MKKRIFYVIMAAALIAALMSCDLESDDDEQEPEGPVFTQLKSTTITSQDAEDGKEVTGVTGIQVAKDDMIYVWVDPLNTEGRTCVDFSALVIKLGSTEYSPGEVDDDQGPIWYYVGRLDGGAWQQLYLYTEWGGNNWRYYDNADEAGSIDVWDSDITIYAINHESHKYEVGVAFKAPAAGTYDIPNFTVYSHGDYVDEDNQGGPGTPPPGDVAVKIGRFVVE
jgi:hypothetical protein